MTNPTDPLPPEVVDELLSAQLDGEFDAAARDHGLSPEAAEAALAASPQAAARRAALARAQQVSANEPRTLTDHDRARLVARATRGDDHVPARAVHPSRRARAREAWLAAAAIVVIAGVLGAVALTNRSTSNDAKSASQTTAGAGAADRSETASGALVDLGVVTGNDALHAAVLRARGAGHAANQQTPPANPTAENSGASSTTASPSDPAHCLAGLGAPATARGLALVGTVTYHGQRLAVATATVGPDTLGWGFHPSTCRIELFYSARD